MPTGTGAIYSAMLAGILFFAQGIGSPQAQEKFPTRPINMIVGFAPGGFPDTTARIFARELSEQLGQNVIVENRPSAGTLVAGGAVARAKPDGYTLLAADSTMWGISPVAFKNVPFDPFRDFEPISIMAVAPVVLVTSGVLPFSNDIKEMTAYFQAHPNKYGFATAGFAGFHHLLIELIQSKLDISLRHLPYQGSSQILPALANNEASLAFQSPRQIQAFLKEGRLKAFAVTGSERVSILPDTPTFKELGIDGMELYGVMGLLAPKGTPSPVIDRLAQAMQVAAQNPQLRKRFEAQATRAVGNTPQEMLEMMKNDATSFAQAAKIAKIEAR